MSQQDDVQAFVLLALHDPSKACSKCMAESVDTLYHRTAVLGSPCWTDNPAERVWEEHLDRTCLNCGHAWCEQTADAYSREEPTIPGGPS
jgi:hypothetical protein